MLPLLYKTNSGVYCPSASDMMFCGRLTKVSKCVVTETLNGDTTLSACVEPTDELIDQIENQRFICTKSNLSDDDQFFEIYKTSIKENGRLNISARHIKHHAFNYLIESATGSPANRTPSEQWNALLNNCVPAGVIPFDFSTDITGKKSVTYAANNAGLLGDAIEEMIKVYNGEIKFDNFHISLLQRRGSNKNFVLRWDKNIASSDLTLSTEQIYSDVVCYAKVKIQDPDKISEIILCSNPNTISINHSLFHKVYMYDATNEVSTTEIGYHDATTYNKILSELNTLASSIVQANNIPGYDIPYEQKINLKINIRSMLDNMKEIELGDTVTVVLKNGRTATARIIKTVFDSLAERWNNIEIGETKVKLSKYIAKRR